MTLNVIFFKGSTTLTNLRTSSVKGHFIRACCCVCWGSAQLEAMWGRVLKWDDHLNIHSSTEAWQNMLKVAFLFETLTNHVRVDFPARNAAVTLAIATETFGFLASSWGECTHRHPYRARLDKRFPSSFCFHVHTEENMVLNYFLPSCLDLQGHSEGAAAYPRSLWEEGQAPRMRYQPIAGPFATPRGFGTLLMGTLIVLWKCPCNF